MKFYINKLGPIERVSFQPNDFTVLTGYQSAGKSTIAKVVYYFRSIKDDLGQLMVDRNLQAVSGQVPFGTVEAALRRHIKEKFLNLFGSSYSMDNSMKIRCEYSDDAKTYIEIFLQEDLNGELPNYVQASISRNILDAIKNPVYSTIIDKTELMQYLNELFFDHYKTVYIPAGRSFITILGDQFLSFYSGMSDTAKRKIDGATLHFLHEIISMRSHFSSGLKGVEREHFESNMNLNKAARTQQTAVFKDAERLADEILNGKYRVVGNEERLVITGKHYVKMNFASSGQQESLWIINILFYYLFQEPVNFIIEEPESHLFPATQKVITEYIALIFKQGNQIFATTHSPYILGALNNLLYANNLSERYTEKENRISKIVPEQYQIDWKLMNAWFVRDGGIEDTIDPESHEIKQDVLDGISEVLNDDFDQLTLCEEEDGSEEETDTEG